MSIYKRTIQFVYEILNMCTPLEAPLPTRSTVVFFSQVLFQWLLNLRTVESHYMSTIDLDLCCQMCSGPHNAAKGSYQLWPAATLSRIW